MTRSSDIGQAPPSPTYAEIASAVRLLDGEPVKRVRADEHDLGSGRFGSTRT